MVTNVIWSCSYGIGFFFFSIDYADVSFEGLDFISYYTRSHLECDRSQNFSISFIQFCHSDQRYDWACARSQNLHSIMLERSMVRSCWHSIAKSSFNSVIVIDGVFEPMLVRRRHCARWCAQTCARAHWISCLWILFCRYCCCSMLFFLVVLVLLSFCEACFDPLVEFVNVNSCFWNCLV